LTPENFKKKKKKEKGHGFFFFFPPDFFFFFWRQKLFHFSSNDNKIYSINQTLILLHSFSFFFFLPFLCIQFFSFWFFRFICLFFFWVDFSTFSDFFSLSRVLPYQSHVSMWRHLINLFFFLTFFPINQRQGVNWIELNWIELNCNLICYKPADHQVAIQASEIKLQL